jgi:hypothetical protein
MVSLANLKKDQLRPLTVNDFYLAIGKFQPSVSKKTI